MGTYRSKIDRWLVAVMAAGGVIMAVAVLAVLPTAETPGQLLAVVAPAALVVGLVLWVFLGTSYELSPQLLRIRSGPFAWRVPLAAIRDVRPSNNPLSSPALSLDRLHVRYEGSRWGILVSPAEKERFLAELAALAPHLEQQERALVERRT